MSHIKALDEVKFPIDWNAFERRALKRLKEIQPNLLSEKANHIVAIKPESRGYVVAKDWVEFDEKFHRHFPRAGRSPWEKLVRVKIHLTESDEALLSLALLRGYRMVGGDTREVQFERRIRRRGKR